MQPSTRAVTFIARDEASSWGRLENVQVCLGRKPPDGPSAATYARLTTDMTKRFPGGYGLITVIRQTSTPLPEARDIIVGAYKANWQYIRAVLFVVEAGGFQAAVQRSILGAVMLATRLRSRIRIVSSIGEGAPWFVETLGADTRTVLDARELERSVTAFCHSEAEPGPTVYNTTTRR